MGKRMWKGEGRAYQHLDIRGGLELGYGGLLLLFGQVAKVVKKLDLLFVEHAADDAGQFGPVDKDWYDLSARML